MDSNLTPSKRPLEHDESSLDPSKLQKTDPNSPPAKTRPVTYKVLCPISQSGSVIGKGGDIVTKIRAETGAKIKLQDALMGCDERVVVITSNYKSPPEESENHENERNGEYNEKGEILPPAFVALMRVFERVVNLNFDINGEEEREEEERESEGIFTFRMLVLSSQVGSILGKNGVIIKKIMADSGAKIIVLSRDMLPYCANTYEDCVQITGEKHQVRNALKSVAEILLDRPYRENPQSNTKTPSSNGPHTGGPARPRKFGAGPRAPPGPPPGPPIETMSYKLLCNNDKVGGVIGKAGHVVKNIKNETGTDVVISELLAGSDSQERMIVVSGPVLYDDGFAPVQTAVMRVLQRLIHGGAAPSETRNGECRIVVPSNQIGCLLGKAGCIINQMRQTSRAFIRVLPKEILPLGLDHHSEVIQITGNAEHIEEAMVQITSRLKHHFMKDKMPPPHHPPFGAHPPFGGMPPPHPYHGPPPFEDNRFPPWGPHGREPMPDYFGGPPGREPFPDYYGGPPIRAGGFHGEDNVPAVIPINLEVIIPRSLIPNLIGEDGEGCLKQIRETSEAKITITEPRPESTETVIMIYGAPEQAYCAKSLLQAFVLSESEGAREV